MAHAQGPAEGSHTSFTTKPLSMQAPGHVRYFFGALSKEVLVWRACLSQKTDAEIQEARAKAARDLVNIDEPERKRRVIFGSVLLVRASPAWLCNMPGPDVTGIRLV